MYLPSGDPSTWVWMLGLGVGSGGFLWWVGLPLANTDQKQPTTRSFFSLNWPQSMAKVDKTGTHLVNQLN